MKKNTKKKVTVCQMTSRIWLHLN